MKIKAEILEFDDNTVKAAFYYDVPNNSHSPASADNSKEPAGAGLDLSQRNELKAGTIIEMIRNINITGMDADQIHAALASSWTNDKAGALAANSRKYSTIFIGNKLIGNNWS